MSAPRQCFVIPVEQFDDNGYIPSLVTEGEHGHAPLTGSGRHSRPWYWGKTYDEATATADRENAKLGLTQQDVTQIVMSSMTHG